MRKMYGFIRKRATYANVAATLALLVAMSGATYALVITSSEIKNNSIRSRDIRDATITGPDLARGSVTSYQVKDDDLKLRDLKKEVFTRFNQTVTTQHLYRSIPIPLRRGRSVRVWDGPSTLHASSKGYSVVASLRIDGGLGSANSNMSHYTVSCFITQPDLLDYDRPSVRVERDVTLSPKYYDQQELTLVSQILPQPEDGPALVIECYYRGNEELVQPARVKEVTVTYTQVDEGHLLGLPR